MLQCMNSNVTVVTFDDLNDTAGELKSMNFKYCLSQISAYSVYCLLVWYLELFTWLNAKIK